ncbi:glycosyltransferase family 4 protein [Patescibacteria group bacterium]|nr:glycosyltransferase family 4 protein [Patescibacteria group bacterium]
MTNLHQKTILFYTDSLIIGGAENQMYLLAKFLDKEKYKVLLVCSDYKQLDDWTEKFVNDGIEVIRLNVLHKHDPRHYFQIKELIKYRDIDLMHIHVWNPASCRYAFMAANKYNIPLVVTEHDPFELTKLKQAIKRNLIKKTDKMIAVSNRNAETLKELFPILKDKIIAVHNGIDITWFESQNLSFTDKKLHEYRDLLGADDKTKLILSVAELHERKGLKYLVGAVEALIQAGENCKLILVGTGPERENLEKLIQEKKLENNVKLLGFRKDIPHLMATCDIFVLPSLKEAFGLVLIEAMTAKLPIVASDVGGIPEIIEAGINGLLVSPKNKKELAESIKKYIDSPELAAKFTEIGYTKAKENFDAKMMAKNTEKIYEEVLSDK